MAHERHKPIHRQTNPNYDSKSIFNKIRFQRNATFVTAKYIFLKLQYLLKALRQKMRRSIIKEDQKLDFLFITRSEFTPIKIE